MMHRRTLIAGAVSLPFFPMEEASAQPDNATDAAWAVLKEARAEYDAIAAADEAWEAALPAHIRQDAWIRWLDYKYEDEVRAARARWERDREAYGPSPYAGPRDEAAKRVVKAERILLETPGSTLVDVKRKLWTMMEALDLECSDLSPRYLKRLIADVRAIDGKTA